MTTSEKTDDIRPRSASGVTVWLMTERHTALTLSAAPATASSAAAGHSDPANPAAASATPQTQTAAIVTRPRRRAESSQPVVSAATAAPAPTDANSSPVPAAPAPKTLTESTGKRARGIPNAIAERSIANDPSSARRHVLALDEVRHAARSRPRRASRSAVQRVCTYTW